MLSHVVRRRCVRTVWHPPARHPALRKFASQCEAAGSARQAVQAWSGECSVVADEVAKLCLPESRRRCLWVLGATAADAGSSSKGAASGGKEIAVFDFKRFEDRRFELALDALEDYLEDVIARASEAFPASLFDDGQLLRELLAHHGDLFTEASEFAGALCPSAKVFVSDAPDPESLGTWLSSEARRENSDLYAITDIRGQIKVLRCIAANAEKRQSPEGYLDRPTGLHRLRYLMWALQRVAQASPSPIVVTFLHLDVLVKSLFIDMRGEGLFLALLEMLQKHDSTEDVAKLRVVFHTADGQTVFRALTPPMARKVKALPSSGSDGSAVGFIAVQKSTRPVHRAGDGPAHEAALSSCEQQSTRERARFEWKMNDMLGHTSMLQLRQAHSDASAAFAVVLWESIRHICRKSHIAMAADAGTIQHPIAEAMLHAGLLEPRWDPTRLVVPDEDTRRWLLEWIDAQHAKLTWAQRVEYNLQLIRERQGIMKRLDQLAW